MESNTKQSNYKDAVMLLIADCSGFDVEEINRDMHLEEDLAFDSLDRHELAIQIWNKFELEEELDPSELQNIKTVEDVLAFVKKYILSI